MKKILTIIILIVLLIPVKVNSIEITGITSNEVVEKKDKGTKNILDDLEYRFLYKEDKDMTDFTILSILIGMMLIIILILYKRRHCRQ